MFCYARKCLASLSLFPHVVIDQHFLLPHEAAPHSSLVAFRLFINFKMCACQRIQNNTMVYENQEQSIKKSQYDESSNNLFSIYCILRRWFPITTHLRFYHWVVFELHYKECCLKTRFQFPSFDRYFSDRYGVPIHQNHKWHHRPSKHSNPRYWQ